jgi:hypothetical protein
MLAKASFKFPRNPCSDATVLSSRSADDAISRTDHRHDIDEAERISHERARLQLVPGNGNNAATSTSLTDSSTAASGAATTNNASMTEVVIRLRLEKMSTAENEDDIVNDYANDDCDDGDDNDDDDVDDDYLSPIPERLANIDAQLFLDAFPFHVLFDRDTIVTSVGSGLEAVVSSSVVGRRVNEAFRLTRPLVQFNWNNVSVSCFIFFQSR